METHQQHDTWIAAVPFSNAVDRRQTARVPCALEVRLGPPKMPAETTLLVEDLSFGGLFIRCSQPVQVGARFSVELMLSSGERLYVPEAEVLYNASGEEPRRGFGARFVSLSREAMALLRTEARFDSELTHPEPASDLPTTNSMILSSAPQSVSTALAETIPSPRKRGRPLGGLVPRISDLRLASLRPRALGERVSQAIDGAIERFMRPTERPMAATVDANGIPTVRPQPILGSEPIDPIDAIAIETARPTPIDDTVPPHAQLEEPVAVLRQTHDENSTVDIHDGIEWQPREVRERRRKRSRGARVMTFGVVAAASVLIVMTVQFAMSSGTSGNEALASDPASAQRVSSATHDALIAPKAPAEVMPTVPLTRPVNKVAAETMLASTAPSSLSSLDRQAEASKLRAQKPAIVPAVKAKVTAAKPTAAAAKKAADGSKRMVLELDPGARVLRTHVLKSPDRFVIDISGQKKVPAILEHDSATARFGMHPDFVRVVIDGSKPIERGEVSMKARRLEVKLTFR